MILSFLILLLSYPLLSMQVTVAMSYYIGRVISGSVCQNMLPGVCCRPPGRRRWVERVTVSNLLVGDIGAVWNHRVVGDLLNGGHVIAGCSGVPAITRAGPIRTWRLSPDDYHPGGSTHVTGASYISIPKQLPPLDTDTPWLYAEGLRGLVWGGGNWFADKDGPSQCSQLHSKRGVISKDKGMVCATAPTLWKYPDLITANGTDYTDNSRGDLVYRSEDGEVSDLSSLDD